MTVPDYTDNWHRYWERRYESGRRLELERAAADPVGRWLTADVREFDEDEIDIDPSALYDHPDTVLGAARDGFGTFVEAADQDPFETAADSYDILPIHVTGVARDRGLSSPVADANTVTSIDNVSIQTDFHRETRAAILTYRCPLGHETELRQQLFRSWRIETCGFEGCANEVTTIDSRTRVRHVAEFSVDWSDHDLSCVVTGRYATAPEVANRLSGAERLSLTGITRLLVADSEGVDPVFELLHAEPM